MGLLRDHPRIKLAKLRQLYYEYFYGTPDPLIANQNISLRLVSNVIKNNNWSVKAPEYRHINQNPMSGYLFLRSVAHIDPMQLVDIDETGSNLDDFGNGLGYSPVGKPYIYIVSF